MISDIVIAHIYPLGMFTIKAGMLSLLFIIPNRSLAYNSLITDWGTFHFFKEGLPALVQLTWQQERLFPRPSSWQGTRGEPCQPGRTGRSEEERTSSDQKGSWR